MTTKLFNVFLYILLPLILLAFAALDIVDHGFGSHELTTRILLIFIGGVVYLFFKSLMAQTLREKSRYNQKIRFFGVCLITVAITNFIMFYNAQNLESTSINSQISPDYKKNS